VHYRGVRPLRLACRLVLYLYAKAHSIFLGHCREIVYSLLHIVSLFSLCHSAGRGAHQIYGIDNGVDSVLVELRDPAGE